MKKFEEIFKEKKAVIGVIHLKGDSESDVKERAKKEIELYINGGLSGIIFEDYFGTYPQLVWALGYYKAQGFRLPFGVNCLNFDSLNFKLARDFDCDFLQLDSVAGHVKPRDEASLDAFFELERPGCNAFVLGGVRFKYQPVLSEKSIEADIAAAKARCDGICVTGDGTGMETPLEKIQRFRAACGKTPLVICSGMNDENCREQLKIADGAVVGSFFKDTGKDTGDVSAEKIKHFMNAVNSLRAEL